MKKTFPPLDKTTWARRLNPLDVLRCAALYLNSSSNNAPSAPDEQTALQIIIHFLLLTQNKSNVALRRTQAMVCALELSVRYHQHDVALDVLLMFLHEKHAPLGATWAAVILLPCFGPFFLRLAAFLDGTKAVPNLPSPPSDTISADLGDLSAEKLDAFRLLRQPDPKDLATFHDAIFESEGGIPGSLQVATYRALPLGTLPINALLGELELAARRRVLQGIDDATAVFRGRVGAPAWAIREAEARLGCSLPLEYRRLLQFTNGWTCNYPYISLADLLMKIA